MPFCNDFGDPGVPDCLKDVDPRYTMDFTGVEPGAFIYWCSRCGPRAHQMGALLNAHVAANGVEEFAALVEDAERTRVLQ